MTKATDDKKETRSFKISELKVEKRDAGGGKKISGYAAVFNSPSEELYGFRETIKPGCFARALREKQDVRALIDHDSSKVLGRSSAGTLRMAEDDKGLRVEIDLPDTSYAQDLVACMDRGDINQMSFGFSTVTDNWRMQDGMTMRDLIDVDLFDVSVVTYPAYPQTDAAVRSKKQWEEKAGAFAHPLEDPAVAKMVTEIGG